MKFLFLILFILFIYSLWVFVIKNRASQFEKPHNFTFKKFLKTPQEEIIKVVEDDKEAREEGVKLFDNVAKLMFEKGIKNKELECANQIQYEFLNKMPAQARSQINQFDLEEWSIYWSYQSQSLEYYASKYGIFYTHVDGEGIEHKMEFKYLA